MAYKYLEHEADFGILASGNTVEEAFGEGAKAMFNLMVDLKEVKPRKHISIECDAGDVAGLFVEFLNKILTEKDVQEMFFSEFNVKEVFIKNGQFHLKATITGEPMDLKKHGVKTEVKAATYSGLKYFEKDKKHFVQCVVDV